MASSKNDQGGFRANLSLLAHQHASDIVSTTGPRVHNPKEGVRVERTYVHKKHLWQPLSSQDLLLSFLLQQQQPVFNFSPPPQNAFLPTIHKGT